jgi:hypothetical protein
LSALTQIFSTIHLEYSKLLITFVGKSLKIMEIKEFIQAKCECGSELMELEYWKDEEEFCFTQFRYAPLSHSFKKRIKFLFTGQIDYNEILLSEENAKLVADYINKHITK